MLIKCKNNILYNIIIKIISCFDWRGLFWQSPSCTDEQGSGTCLSWERSRGNVLSQAVLSQPQQGGCTFRVSWTRADIRYIQRGCWRASDLIMLWIWAWQKFIILSHAAQFSRTYAGCEIQWFLKQDAWKSWNVYIEKPKYCYCVMCYDFGLVEFPNISYPSLC